MFRRKSNKMPDSKYRMEKSYTAKSCSEQSKIRVGAQVISDGKYATPSLSSHPVYKFG
jgi:hypothetical protein